MTLQRRHEEAARRALGREIDAGLLILAGFNTLSIIGIFIDDFGMIVTCQAVGLLLALGFYFERRHRIRKAIDRDDAELRERDAELREREERARRLGL